MNTLTPKETQDVNGAYVNFSHEHRCNLSHREEIKTIFTMQFDGSTPPEFQRRIDAGESFDSMKKDLRMYHTIRMMMKANTPHLFSD